MAGHRVCHFKLVLLGDTAVGKVEVEIAKAPFYADKYIHVSDVWMLLVSMLVLSGGSVCPGRILRVPGAHHRGSFPHTDSRSR